jgi:tetratricopeptide (TPR) repeat protein
MRLWAGLIVLCAAHAAVAQVSDEERTARARIHLKSAIAYYDDGRYEDAAREMRSAYDLRPLPDLQYNLAQCYERLNRLEDAARSYEAYLRERADAPDRKNVQSRIDNLRERARAEANGQVLPSPAPVGEKVVFKTIVVYREKAAPPGRAARWAAYGLGVLALAGVATGIAYAVLAEKAANKVTQGGNVMNPPTFDGKLRDTQDSGKSYPIVSGVSFGVAGLAAIGAIGLYVAGQKIDREAAKREARESASRGRWWTLAPTFAPTGGGIAAMGGF